ncbi:protein of unknown function DUF504 [Pyrolobus fumarii 1A]|uniref:MJ1316 RNA cyclic group end recognition domain-containing protein n=1 Tax=Pyrolobus fumarii (strain DSM 11204 / 1A) TaxID=694429 RepID=G0ED48_PYRF1|nr:RNA repair domain-containing protein [Pyrolobus fumarii]AEM39726.1 protein of unknown function DUF504 [Pyrolobus fumarii 1A]
MGRRRGRIYEVVSRVFALREQYPDARIVIVDRVSPTGLRKIPVSRVTRVKKDHMVLDDGSVIPLHRVVMVEAGDAVLWRRGGDVDASEEPVDDSKGESQY